MSESWAEQTAAWKRRAHERLFEKIAAQTQRRAAPAPPRRPPLPEPTLEDIREATARDPVHIVRADGPEQDAADDAWAAQVTAAMQAGDVTHEPVLDDPMPDYDGPQ